MRWLVIDGSSDAGDQPSPGSGTEAVDVPLLIPSMPGVGCMGWAIKAVTVPLLPTIDAGGGVYATQ